MIPLLLLIAHLLLPRPAPAARLRAVDLDLRLIAALALGAGVMLFLLLGSATVTAAACVVVGTAGRVLIDVRATRRTHHREVHAATFLGHLSGELRAGHTMATAVTHAAGQLPADAPRDLAEVLTQVSGHTRRGLSGALVLTAGGLPELTGLGTLWTLADRHGLPLAPLVEQAQLRIDTRLRHRAATTATLQGPQATAVILTLLPLAGIAMGTAMGANPVAFLLGGGLGGVLLAVGTVLAAGGFLWSRLIIRRAAP